DRIKIRNPRTGRLMSRVPDVGNPWLDAGIVAFSTMGYNTNRAYWRKWYPADFITESFPGQFRNWFYALLAMSAMMADGEPPFKTLLGFATVKDQFGQDMHKSAANSIEFIAAAAEGGTLPDQQELITHARQAFEAYNVMAFCQEAERFVDDRLSNWYIRRNRQRFQSNVEELDGAGRRDKWAAHQTLYTVLVTLSKLFAPVIP